MRGAYRVLAHVIAILVFLQAMVIAGAMFGLGKYVDDGGVVNKAFADDQDTIHFTAERGFAFHAIDGTTVIPIVALALLIVSFFARVPGGVRLALIVLALVVIQVVLGRCRATCRGWAWCTRPTRSSSSGPRSSPPGAPRRGP